jgi:hypothetical protein
LMTEMVTSSKSMLDLAEEQRGSLRRFRTGAPSPEGGSNEGPP